MSEYLRPHPEDGEPQAEPLDEHTAARKATEHGFTYPMEETMKRLDWLAEKKLKGKTTAGERLEEEQRDASSAASALIKSISSERGDTYVHEHDQDNERHIHNVLVAQDILSKDIQERYDLPDILNHFPVDVQELMLSDLYETQRVSKRRERDNIQAAWAVDAAEAAARMTTPNETPPNVRVLRWLQAVVKKGRRVPGWPPHRV